MSAHTPGPWESDERGVRAPPTSTGRAYRRVAIMVNGGAQSYSENTANKSLIAAAPDMLAELKKLIRLYPHSETAEIIAKAEGRS